MVATRNEDPGSGQTIEDANVKMKDGIRAWVVAFGMYSHSVFQETWTFMLLDKVHILKIISLILWWKF